MSVLQLINLGSGLDAGDGTASPRAGGAIINAAIESLDLAGFTTVSSSRAITNTDNRQYLTINGLDLTLTWPDSLADGHLVTVLLSGDSSLTVAGSGSATFTPTGVVVENADGDLTAVVVIHRTGGAHVVISPGVPDTVTVIYDAGWPASRPSATHVHAVGHTSAPAWLTSADIWYEAV